MQGREVRQPTQKKEDVRKRKWEGEKRERKNWVLLTVREWHTTYTISTVHINIPNALLQPLRPALVEFNFIHCPHCTFYILYSHKTFVQAQVVSYCILTIRDILFYKYNTQLLQILKFCFSIMSFAWWHFKSTRWNLEWAWKCLNLKKSFFFRSLDCVCRLKIRLNWEIYSSGSERKVQYIAGI